MRPTQNMFASKTEWQDELIKWMEMNPSHENDKEFILFEGTVSPENFVFMGTMSEYVDKEFSHAAWEILTELANTQGHIILIEGTVEYDSAIEMIELEETDADEDTPASVMLFAPNVRSTEWDDDMRDFRTYRK
jgi:hypothetical protein